jgi:hypothetical protein
MLDGAISLNLENTKACYMTNSVSDCWCRLSVRLKHFISACLRDTTSQGVVRPHLQNTVPGRMPYMSSVCPRNMTAHYVSDSVACLIPEHYSSLYALLFIFKTEHFAGSLCVYFRITAADRTARSVCSSGTRQPAALQTVLYLVAPQTKQRYGSLLHVIR